MILNKVDVAWAAGFLEGEGSMYLRKRTSLQFSAPQQTPEPLNKLVKIFGGKVYGPSPPRGLGNKPGYTWQLGGHANCQAALAAMWSFLSSRRREQWGSILKQANSYRPKWRDCKDAGHPIIQINGYPACGISRRKNHIMAPS